MALFGISEGDPTDRHNTQNKKLFREKNLVYLHAFKRKILMDTQLIAEEIFESFTEAGLVETLANGNYEMTQLGMDFLQFIHRIHLKNQN